MRLATKRQMIRLYNSDTGEPIGEINEEQMELLIDQLEEETEDDESYYIDVSTIEYLEEAGADEELLTLLRKGLGEEEGIEISIEEEEGAAAG
jgi:processive 1,2-diacylglycerol beta-glucosyltransferase